MRISGIRTALLTLIVTSLVAGQAPSQNSSATRIAITVAALHPDGTRDVSLKQSDFKILEDGVNQRITSFSDPDDVNNILLVLDHNNTWLDDAAGRAAMEAWQKIQVALGNFMGQLHPQDRIAVATFEDRVQMALPWRTLKGPQVTTNLKVITARQAAVKDLYGTIQWALQQFEAAKGRKLIVIFTDGRDARLAPHWYENEDGHEILDPLAALPDDGEISEFQAGLSAIRKRGIPIYFLTPIPDRSATFAGPSGWDYHLNGMSGNSTLATQYLEKVRSRLNQFAEASGGRVFYLNGPDNAATILSQLPLSLALKQSYSLEYMSSPSSNDAFHRIEVQIRNGEFAAAQSRAGYSTK
jgi:VWFA-related protein